MKSKKLMKFSFNKILYNKINQRLVYKVILNKSILLKKTLQQLIKMIIKFNELLKLLLK